MASKEIKHTNSDAVLLGTIQRALLTAINSSMKYSKNDIMYKSHATKLKKILEDVSFDYGSVVDELIEG